MTIVIKDIRATNPRPSTAVPASGAFDFDIEIETYGGSGRYSGEITLVPNHDACSRIRLVGRGKPEDWIDGVLWRRLKGTFEEEELLDLLPRIARSAREALAAAKAEAVDAIEDKAATP
jgi:hypothetical protein